MYSARDKYNLILIWFHICYFIVLMFSLLFYNVENSTNKNPWMSRCVQTLHWYCTYTQSRVLPLLLYTYLQTNSTLSNHLMLMEGDIPCFGDWRGNYDAHDRPVWHVLEAPGKIPVFCCCRELIPALSPTSGHISTHWNICDPLLDTYWVIQNVTTFHFQITPEKANNFVHNSFITKCKNTSVLET